MASPKIIDRDRGWKKIRRSLMREANLKVKVGIQGSEASASHGSLTNVELGAIHEFGLGQVERPFLRGTVDRERQNIVKQFDRVGKAIARGENKRKMLGRLGEWVRAQVIKTFNQSLGLSPNAPSTIERKGSSRPLIDTGQLKGSITSVVE